jgi:chromosomal replication initiator protein
MSLVENYAAERRARLARLGAIPTRSTVSRLTEAQIVREVSPTIHVPPVEDFYQNFWCWDLVACENKIVPTIKNIQMVVAAHFGVSIMHMVAHRRSADIVLPRQIGYYLSKVLTGLSFPVIGRYFGGRDHSTILHGVAKIEARMESEPELSATIQGLRGRFE